MADSHGGEVADEEDTFGLDFCEVESAAVPTPNANRRQRVSNLQRCPINSRRRAALQRHAAARQCGSATVGRPHDGVKDTAADEYSCLLLLNGGVQSSVDCVLLRSVIDAVAQQQRQLHTTDDEDACDTSDNSPFFVHTFFDHAAIYAGIVTRSEHVAAALRDELEGLLLPAAGGVSHSSAIGFQPSGLAVEPTSLNDLSRLFPSVAQLHTARATISLVAVGADAIEAVADGLVYRPDHVSQAEALEIVEWLSSSDDLTLRNAWEHLATRRVLHVGRRFDYATNTVATDDAKVVAPCAALAAVMQRTREWVQSLEQPWARTECLEQVTINHYRPGQGIPPHVDSHHGLGEVIVTISLGAGLGCVMDFVSHVGGGGGCPVAEASKALLEPRSMLVMSGTARYAFTHGIANRHSDVISSGPVGVSYRQERWSITMRSARVPPGCSPDSCPCPALCSR